MTAPLTPVAAASKRIADAVSSVPDLRVVTTVATPITPPAAVIGPPRLNWMGEASFGAGQPTTGQWNVYLVVAMNQYSIDVLLSQVAAVTTAIERLTPGVVLGAGPGIFPSPSGPLPAYTIMVQMEVGMI